MCTQLYLKFDHNYIKFYKFRLQWDYFIQFHFFNKGFEKLKQSFCPENFSGSVSPIINLKQVRRIYPDYYRDQNDKNSRFFQSSHKCQNNQSLENES